MKRVMFIVVLMLLVSQAFVTAGEIREVTVGAISYLSLEYPGSFADRITLLQEKIDSALTNSEGFNLDLIFEPEYTLVRSHYSSSDPSIVEIIENGPGDYSVSSIGTLESDLVVDHINTWLIERAQEHHVNFFTNVHERVEYEPGQYAHGITGIIINHLGNIAGIKRKIEFHPTEQMQQIVGPTINSFTILNQEGKSFVVLPFICADLWTTETLNWYAQMLHDNNAKPADIVIHSVAMGDWLYHQLFFDIQDGTFDPDNPPVDMYDWFWNETVEPTLIQHYMQQEKLIKSINSYYFATDRVGNDEFGSNTGAFELISFPLGPNPFSLEDYLFTDDYLIAKVDIYYPSGGGGCFLSGTPILMADGTKKSIEKIKIGDRVLAFDEESGDLKEDVVKEFFVHTTHDYLLINNYLRVTKNHPVFSNGEWVEIGILKVGDTLTGSQGKPIKISSIREINHPDIDIPIYNLEVNPYHTYIAGGIIAHNKPPKKKVADSLADPPEE